MRKYPNDYKGPKAGESTRKDYLEVRDYDAFCKFLQKQQRDTTKKANDLL